jgi:hypothetical protein
MSISDLVRLLAYVVADGYLDPPAGTPVRFQRSLSVTIASTGAP